MQLTNPEEKSLGKHRWNPRETFIAAEAGPTPKCWTLMGTQQSRLIWGWSVFGMIAQPACEASFSGVTWSYASTEFASRKRPSDQLDFQKHPQHPDPDHETSSTTLPTAL